MTDIRRGMIVRRKIPDLENSRYIDLSLSLEMGRGNKRVCFEHPENKQLYVKIAYRQDGWQESVIESIYEESKYTS